jgi:lipooligosaccharide transport system permease protein
MRNPSAAPAPPLRELAYWLFRYRRTWRGTIVISVVNPLLFLAAVGVGLGTLVDQNHSGYLHGQSYLQFFMPGLLAAATMQTAYVEAAGPVLQSMRARGNYRAAIATEMSPSDVLHGHLTFMILRVAISATLFTLVGVAFGAVAPARAPLLVLSAVLIGCAFVPPLAAYAVTAGRPANLTAVLRFVIMPLYMFSGTFFAVRQLPRWLQAVIEVTPLWHGVELCRSAALGTATFRATIVHIGYLAAMSAVGLLLARRNYYRQLHI